VIDEFISNNKQYVNHGISKNGEPLGAGEYATWMLNGPEGWKLVAFLPNGSGMVGIILQRKVRVSLPDPKMIETEVKVEAPTDAELKATEAKGLEWAGVAGAQEAAEEAVVALEGPDFGTDPLGGSQPVEGADYVAPEQSSESGQ
jgi:hypothetical protein